MPASPVPLPPHQSVNVFSYTGYALSKGLRPPFKSPATPAPPIMGPMSLPTVGFAHPGVHASQVPSFNYGVSHVPNISVSPYVTSNQHFMTPAVMTNSMAGMAGLPSMVPSVGGLTTGVAPSMGGVAGFSGLGGSIPMMTPSIMMPQNPAPSLYSPQYTALSSNTHYSLAQGGEQPNKRLKTS